MQKTVIFIITYINIRKQSKTPFQKRLSGSTNLELDGSETGDFCVTSENGLSIHTELALMTGRICHIYVQLYIYSSVEQMYSFNQSERTKLYNYATIQLCKYTSIHARMHVCIFTAIGPKCHNYAQTCLSLGPNELSTKSILRKERNRR